MSEVSLSADFELAKALEALEKSEYKAKHLQSKVDELDGRVERRDKKLKELTESLKKLQHAKNELMRVNNEWDIEYKEQELAFRRYRDDSQRAQSEHIDFIAKLKAEKEELAEEVRTLRYELERTRNDLVVERQRTRDSSDEYHRLGEHRADFSQRRMKELEEEMLLLRQQLRTYQEDFEAERRDRERINDEKQSAGLRYEAEITSLRLQLDRCRNELTHYTAETNRLAQQLRLKSQFDEAQYRQHLESKGYRPRSPNGALPPLDPYVEIDQRHLLNPIHKTSSRSENGLCNLDYNSRNMPNGRDYTLTGGGEGGGRRQYRAPPGLLARDLQSVSAPNSLRKTPSPPLTRYSNASPPPVMNGHATPQELVTPGMKVTPPNPTFSNPDVSTIPPLETKGKYSCPRCARKFMDKRECEHHKARCLS